MNDYISKVKEFHETFNHPVNDQKDSIDLKTRQLRVKLLFEELRELSDSSDVRLTFAELCRDNNLKFEAFSDGDDVNKKEELDALCDIQYVLSGAVLALGYQDVFDESFDEVQSSNMSKMCHSEKEVDDTTNSYKEKGVESYSIKKGDGWIVLRKEDDKILKNKYYQEANLNQFIK